MYCVEQTRPHRTEWMPMLLRKWRQISKSVILTLRQERRLLLTLSARCRCKLNFTRIPKQDMHLTCRKQECQIYRYQKFKALTFLLSYRTDTSTITSSGFMVLGNFLTELGDSQLASMDKVGIYCCMGRYSNSHHQLKRSFLSRAFKLHVSELLL